MIELYIIAVLPALIFIGVTLYFVTTNKNKEKQTYSDFKYDELRDIIKECRNEVYRLKDMAADLRTELESIKKKQKYDR